MAEVEFRRISRREGSSLALERAEGTETVNKLALGDYRVIMVALDRADADLIEGSVDIHRYRGLTVDHLTAIREAVEDCLFRDHNRLGFASENPPAAQPKRAVKARSRRRPRLSVDDIKDIRTSTCPLRVLAERYGFSICYLGKIRRGLEPGNFKVSYETQ
jgi:hypothetical protein